MRPDTNFLRAAYDLREGSLARLRRLRRSAGFTLLGGTLLAGLLVLVLSGFAGALANPDSATEASRENALAHAAVRRVVEELSRRPFAEVFAACNATRADDAGLSAPAIGPDFAVEGLVPVPGDPDGCCGRIELPTRIVDGVEELREDGDDPRLGMPRDLDGANGIDAEDHARDYRLLPLRVRIEWSGASGPRQFELETMLGPR